MSVETLIKKIEEKIIDRLLFAIFDRDGTLVPINPDPDAAILSDEVLTLMLELNSLPTITIAILSARDLNQLREDFKMNNLILAGNYGMELLIPGEQLWQESNAVNAKNRLLEVETELQKLLSEETCVILEDHQLTLCLHWHRTPAKYRQTVHDCIKILESKYTDLLFKTLPTSYEIWPSIQWDKSDGLKKMVSALRINLDKYCILYVGDSDSDEPAFAWVNAHQGVTVRVGQKTKSVAQFNVQSPKEVEQILKFLVTGVKKT